MTSATGLPPSYLDVAKLAIASFLARYREPTLTAYTQDLKAYAGWCWHSDRQVPRVTRGELEMYVRYREGRGHAAATIARRLGAAVSRTRRRRLTCALARTLPSRFDAARA